MTHDIIIAAAMGSAFFCFSFLFSCSCSVCFCLLFIMMLLHGNSRRPWSNPMFEWCRVITWKGIIARFSSLFLLLLYLECQRRCSVCALLARDQSSTSRLNDMCMFRSDNRSTIPFNRIMINSNIMRRIMFVSRWWQGKECRSGVKARKSRDVNAKQWNSWNMNVKLIRICGSFKS